MKILNREEFMAAAGTPLFHNRDFSLYEGAPFECACGSIHDFRQYGQLQHFGSSGGNAKFIVQCPCNNNIATIIQTKNKFLFIFDRFVSLAGYIAEAK